MESLHKYLVEKFELAKAVNFIQTIIDDKDEPAIKAAYYAISKEEQTQFEEFCKDKGIPVPVVSGSIWDIFKKYESVDLLLDIMNGDKIPISDILGADKVDLVEILNKHYDVSKISPDLIKSLFKLTFIMNGIAVGPGEFFLVCLLMVVKKLVRELIFKSMVLILSSKEPVQNFMV